VLAITTPVWFLAVNVTIAELGEGLAYATPVL
jgi:hypothetical protein